MRRTDLEFNLESLNFRPVRTGDSIHFRNVELEPVHVDHSVPKVYGFIAQGPYSYKEQNVLFGHSDNREEGSWMPTAFVLINTELGSETDVLKDLKKVAGVDEVFAVYGTYDIVARVKAETMDRLKEIVTVRIRKVNNVRATLTLMCSEGAK
jgi:DNA-binding Lrp family transcriptional regulator